MKYFLSVLLLVSAGLAFADDFDAVEAKLKTALAADIRTDAEKDRDRNRKPIATLKFFGLRDDMKIVELIPGGGENVRTKLAVTLPLFLTPKAVSGEA